MNLKTFAQQSRTILMQGVAKKLLFWGFDDQGNVVEEVQKISGGYLLRGEPYDDPTVPALWEALKKAVKAKGIDVVMEEAAYTWFNRMMAIKILAKNGYDEPQLDNVEGMQHTPLLLQRARQGSYAFLKSTEEDRLKKIINDYTKDQEAFALLLTGYCHNHNTLNRVFGRLNDYTELLLPDNMLQDGGFLDLLNTSDAISEEHYQSVELIGWLYQFYISEKKDEVFASFKKRKKAEAKDIPAATQIFTPNWIVKYMVENTAGKIWLDKHPDSTLKGNMKYLVENESDCTNEPIINSVEDLTLIDPACGSGHILVEGFDLLYQMYMEEFYPPEEAVESILSNNLFGLDIDDRAAQLATFATLLKAAKRYPDIWTKDWLPQVYAMPEARSFSQQELKDFLGDKGHDYLEELDDALHLMRQAKNLGSVMKLSLSNKARTFIAQRFEELKTATYRDFNEEAVFQSIQTYIPVLLVLTKKYTSVVANPPYLGSGKVNHELKNYLSINYKHTKGDLYAVFIEVCLEFNKKGGLSSLINQQAWIFLKAYESFRKEFIHKYQFRTLIQLGSNTFKELSGEQVKSVVFSIQNSLPKKGNIYFYRLTEFNTVEAKENAFLNRTNQFIKNDQLLFEYVPGAPFAFWISDKLLSNFSNEKLLTDFTTNTGLVPGDTDRFLKYFWEVTFKTINFSIKSKRDLNRNTHWVPISHGGRKTKWYGSYDEIVLYKNNARKIRAQENSMFRNENMYFKEGVNWNRFNPSTFAARMTPDGFVFEDSSPTLISNHNQLYYILGLFNSNTFNSYIKIFQGGQKVEKGHVNNCPVVYKPSSTIDNLVVASIRISKLDWDSRETSWDFEQSPLLNDTLSLEQAYQSWQEKVTQDFFQLHTNEEELNRIFIDIYGLQDELTPEVELKDITILQEELAKKDLEALEDDFRANGQEAINLPIDKEEVISQFISYAIGLFMGRYRLDKPGLNIAHPNPTTEELASYIYNDSKVIIDEDAILPLMGTGCNFPDDALHQIHQLLDTLWGHDTRTENINFIQECLDKDLEKFLVKDFYKYHCSMYKKKPIYWLFSSKKGAFQVLVYVHRMNEFTAEKIRANYLLEHIKNLRQEEAILDGNETNLSTQEARKLDQLRKDILECEEYDMELKNVADQQIKFDLDDGVTVNYKLFESVVAKIK
tara:strand:+ start:82030 stop:85539 length:3510 start_codon:yes stop_codon:yes gene_type:complete